MLDYSAAIALVGMVVTIGVSLTGVMFHWLRSDIKQSEAKRETSTAEVKTELMAAQEKNHSILYHLNDSFQKHQLADVETFERIRGTLEQIKMRLP